MNPTTAQRQAIESEAKNILVVAGPGSGKTATTVKRINRLLQDGVSPRSIVALTFTNAAASELERRIYSSALDPKVGNFERLGYIGTLHGFALKMLKQYGAGMGYGERLALIGEEAVSDLIESKAKTLGCKTPLKKLLKLKAEFGPDSYRARLTDDGRVIAAYYAELRESGLVDFDTILTEFRRLLDDPDIAPELMIRFTHLFVDEVQDSAAIDWAIYCALPMANKFFVGDQDQSIYGFRGGRPDLMMSKPVTAKGEGEVILLEDNFRSHSEICVAAQSLIEHNGGRIPKVTRSVSGPGGCITTFAPCQNEGEEVACVTRMIGRRLVQKGYGDTCSSEIAILCRNNDLAIAFRDQLRAAGIPVAEDEQRNLPTDWALAKSLVELLVNPENDTLAMFYMTAGQLAEGKSNVVARSIVRDSKLSAARNGKSMNATFLHFPINMSIEIATEFLAADLSKETMMRIATIIRRLPAGSDLLALALAMGQEEGETKDAVEGVTVTTMHGAKGREFDSVFIVGFEDEILPGNRKSDGPEQVEEARRLAYVAVTRARKHLFFSYSLSRETSWGAIEVHKPSRFLKEMGL